VLVRGSQAAARGRWMRQPEDYVLLSYGNQAFALPAWRRRERGFLSKLREFEDFQYFALIPINNLVIMSCLQQNKTCDSTALRSRHGDNRFPDQACGLPAGMRIAPPRQQADATRRPRMRNQTIF
jgi:hypothetical protein